MFLLNGSAEGSTFVTPVVTAQKCVACVNPDKRQNGKDGRITGHVYINFTAINKDFSLLCHVTSN